MSESTRLNELKQLVQQSKFEQAIQIANESLLSSEYANHADVLYILAVAYRLSAQTDLALTTLERLLNLTPEHARAQQEQGYIFRAQGKTLEATKAFYAATQSNPALLSAWSALVPLYEALRNTQARQIASEQVAYLSKLPRPVLGALDLMYEGDLSSADKICRQFLQQHKHQQDAMLCLAQIGVRMKVYGEAEFILESCVELYPTFFPATLELLKLYAKQGKFSAVIDRISASPESFKSHPQIIVAKASAQVGVGELDAAINDYSELLSKDSGQYAVHLLLGHAYKARGDFNEAIEHYRKAYTNKSDCGDAYWSLANTKTYTFSAEEIAEMEHKVKMEEVAIDDRIHFAFALGKAHEDNEAFDKSFSYYELGNRLKMDLSGYDINRTEDYIATIIDNFTPEVFERTKNPGCNDDAPIFIVGLPRAGSTLLEQILASHSKVDGTMELHNILGLAARLQKRGYPGGLDTLDPQYFERFGEQFIQDTQSYRRDAPFFIDKMPNNFMHIGLIKLILPNAKIIDARREPMACCFSGFKQLFGDGQEFSYGLASIARYYRAYEKLMQHWDRVLPGFVLRVQHEDVVNDLDSQVRKILDFCGLPFEQSCIDFYQTKRAIKTPSSEQVRQPIYRSGLEQWKHYEQYLSPLILSLQNKSI